MPLPPLDHPRIDEVFESACHAFGEGADPDEAFDDAAAASVTSAGFAAADPGNLEVIETGLSADQAIARALVWLRQNPESVTVAAFGLVGRSAHTRTTRRFRLEGVNLEPDTTPAGRWAAPTGALAEAVRAQETWDVSDDEDLEFVEYTRRARYKPVVEVNRTKSAGQFVALADDRVVTFGHRTAGDARREAVRLLKERGKDDHELAAMSVYKLGGREDDKPLMSITRTRVTQVVGVKMVHARAKSPTVSKTVGWLFVTHAG